MDVWMVRRMDVLRDGEVDVWMDGCEDGCINGRTD